jgi:hypothetical protein
MPNINDVYTLKAIKQIEDMPKYLLFLLPPELMEIKTEHF